ncbi:hypothetical protein M3914_002457 [Vibrio metschnikovii]|nr:hypothetical protein [Vibrio metschnikovii]EKO3684253.1 hypothetical protein [Vibrio metschnikovii]EKO3874068.1 hypothetical protein [Vibrio metschnikovii]
MYQTITHQHLLPDTLVQAWCLDFPIDKNTFTLKQLQSDGTGLLIQGWVMLTTELPWSVYCVQNDMVEALPKVSRRDVCQHLFGAQMPSAWQRDCGFRKTLFPISDQLQIRIKIADQDYPLLDIAIQGQLQVLEGKDGWLFLDNDTNHSVDQFIGKKPLSASDLEQWSEYLNHFNRLADKHSLKHALLIAPAKEMVLSAYYPRTLGKQVPIRQLMPLTEGNPVIYPEAELRAMPEPAFRKLDTHWTHKGCLQTWLTLLDSWQLLTDQHQQTFNQLSFVDRTMGGDLGNKCFPPRKATETCLAKSLYRSKLVFDNQLPNMGRVFICVNPSAYYQQTLLIFGSSSSYSLMEFACLTFQNIVFIHSAGKIDPQLVMQVKPDYLLAQTNGRFIVNPPSVDYCWPDVAREKWQQLETQVKEQLLSQHIDRSHPLASPFRIDLEQPIQRIEDKLPPIVKSSKPDGWQLLKRKLKRKLQRILAS